MYSGQDKQMQKSWLEPPSCVLQDLLCNNVTSITSKTAICSAYVGEEGIDAGTGRNGGSSLNRKARWLH